jgi:hypothetical protein
MHAALEPLRARRRNRRARTAGDLSAIRSSDLDRLLEWMAKQDFATISQGEPSLIRQVEEIVIESHRRLYQVEGRDWSEAMAYRWFRFEDPMPVARLQDGLEELRRRAADIDSDAVDKVCKDAVKHGFSY